MYVALAKLVVAIGQSHSLKDKRMVVRRIKDRVRDRLGIVVNEVGDLDVWQRAELGCAVVSGDRAKAMEKIDEVIRVIAGSGADVVAIAKDTWTFDAAPVPIAVVDDRTGTGDKAAAAAAGDDDWIPDDWRDEATEDDRSISSAGRNHPDPRKSRIGATEDDRSISSAAQEHVGPSKPRSGVSS